MEVALSYLSGFFNDVIKQLGTTFLDSFLKISHHILLGLGWMGWLELFLQMVLPTTDNNNDKATQEQYNQVRNIQMERHNRYHDYALSKNA